jgi:hypothetical protein
LSLQFDKKLIIAKGSSQISGRLSVDAEGIVEARLST